jgi:hypothetical protein
MEGVGHLNNARKCRELYRQYYKIFWSYQPCARAEERQALLATKLIKSDGWQDHVLNDLYILENESLHQVLGIQIQKN